MPVDLAPSMTEGGIKEAVAALLGLAVGTFGIKSVDGARGSGFHAGLKGDWDVVLLPVATTGAAAFDFAAAFAMLQAKGTAPSTQAPPPVSRAFSAVSASLSSRATSALGYRSLGYLRSDASALLPPEGPIAPFVWGTLGETAASPALLDLLSSSVCAHPTVRGRFHDVRSFTSADPLVLDVELTDGTTARFSGMVDAVATGAGMVRLEELAPVASSALVCIAWKTPEAFAIASSISAIARVQVLALAVASGGRAPPVFMTDMATGFRAWVLIGDAFYHLHPEGCNLSLAEGIALIRLFLARGEEGAPAAVIEGASPSDVALGFGEPRRGRGARQSGSGRGGGDGSPTRDSAFTGAPCTGVERTGAENEAATPACAAGDDGEDDSPETLMQEIAVALSRGGGFRIPF